MSNVRMNYADCFKLAAGLVTFHDNHDSCQPDAIAGSLLVADKHSTYLSLAITIRPSFHASCNKTYIMSDASIVLSSHSATPTLITTTDPCQVPFHLPLPASAYLIGTTVGEVYNDVWVHDGQVLDVISDGTLLSVVSRGTLYV